MPEKISWNSLRVSTPLKTFHFETVIFKKNSCPLLKIFSLFAPDFGISSQARFSQPDACSQHSWRREKKKSEDKTKRTRRTLHHQKEIIPETNSFDPNSENESSFFPPFICKIRMIKRLGNDTEKDLYRRLVRKLIAHFNFPSPFPLTSLFLTDFVIYFEPCPRF